MQKKHSILIPIDGSMPSLKAFDEALLLAKKLNYSLECIYVIEPVRVLDHDVMQSIKQAMQFDEQCNNPGCHIENY